MQKSDQKQNRELEAKLHETERHLAEAEETIHAIRTGMVDAIVVFGEKGEQVYTLQGADRPYRAIIEAMNEGAVTIGGNFTILYSNNRFASMLGLPFDAVIGQPIENFIQPQLREQFTDFCSRAFLANSKEEFAFQAVDGVTVPVLLSSTIVEMESGRDICLVVTDLTELKIAEAILRQKEEEIREQLRQRQEMRFLTQLTSGVAHEVRNPLHALMSISEALIQEMGDNPVFIQYQKHIRIQADRLNELMLDLLEIGKPIEESHFALMPVITLCQKVAEAWNSSDGDHPHVALIVERGSETAVIRGSQLRLEQVLVNLFENAAQHSPKESGIILQVSKPETGKIRIEVIDRGTGIKPEFLDRLFDPFFTTRKAGTGLGLNIVKHTLDGHGGSIVIRNCDPGPGARAIVTLSVVQE